MSDDKKKLRSKTYKLEYPFKWDGDEEVTEVTLHRPKGKHIKNLGKNTSMKDLIMIACKTSGFTPGFFDEMDGADVIAITEIVGDFLDNGQTTGEI